MAAAAVGCMLVRELSSQAFALTMTHLSDVLAAIQRGPNEVTRLIQRDLTDVVPSAKLRIVHAMLIDFEWLRDRSRTIDSLCDRLTELAQSIHFRTHAIGDEIDRFNALYFRSWRTLDVTGHISGIKADVVQLNETFELFKALLPSCLALDAKAPSMAQQSTFRRQQLPPALHPLPAIEAPPTLAPAVDTKDGTDGSGAAASAGAVTVTAFSPSAPAGETTGVIMSIQTETGRDDVSEAAASAIAFPIQREASRGSAVGSAAPIVIGEPKGTKKDVACPSVCGGACCSSHADQACHPFARDPAQTVGSHGSDPQPYPPSGAQVVTSVD
jgi:hypothetical protein